MKKILAVIFILLGLFFVIQGWWNSQLAAVSQDKTPKKIIIAKGKSLNEIAKQLKQANLIKSELIFSLYTRKLGLSNKLSAGTFDLSSSMSTPEMVKMLTGKPSESWVTLIEGWRVEEMADKLHKELGISEEEFLRSAKEGYMFPDTYLFAHDATSQQVASRLKNTFEEKFSDDLKAKISSQGLTVDQGVILASIVEREARSEKARTEVASILLKRFKIDMGLNADATLQYILGYQQQEKSWWKRHLGAEDKAIDSPYNTYLYKGLPPKPICNPGRASLKAVANADPSIPYLYYYHDSKGDSHYATTLEEHNQNVANNP